MPIVCINRPNRSKPRKYSEADVARIAGYVEESGVPWAVIIGFIAGTGGFAYLLCRMLSLVRLWDVVREYLRDLGDLAIVTGAITAAIRFLSIGRTLPLVRVIVVTLLAFLGATLIFLRRMEQEKQAIEDAQGTNEAIEWLETACNAAQARIDSLIQGGKADMIKGQDRVDRGLDNG